MKIKSLLSVLFLFLAISTFNIVHAGNSKYVNPYIGSGGHGHVFVGANVPFGAVQVGPMNIWKGWDWCSGYHYSDSIIIGFSHTHLSGTGCSDLGDVSLMPYSGVLRTLVGTGNDLSGAASSRFSHTKETVSAGYYAVKLDNGVDVELTATERVGIHHYHYNQPGAARLLIDLVTGVEDRPYEGYIKMVDNYTIEGFRFIRGWSPMRKVFFHACFNKPINQLDVFAGDNPMGKNELQTRNVKGVVTFGSDVNDVMVKVALSSVSCANAKMNMEQEAHEWDFVKYRTQATRAWDKALGCIDIDGDSKERTIFYTSLYHMMIAPNLFCDVNGDFRGMDDQIYRNNNFHNYTVFSLWDTYRTLHPLFTLIASDRVPDMINSMLSIYDQNGKLPIWPLQSGETNCMPGFSSVPVIADAYLKGFKGFDAERALKYMVATATNPKQNGVPELMKFGYIPADLKGQATSINLEYAVDDWGLALMAKAMGRSDIYQTFIKYGKSYQLLWDPSINKIHPKMADGSWYEPYNPFLADMRGIGDFTEGNGWQYTFMVPQDPNGLITLNGGDAAFIKNLDSLFVATGDLGAGAPPDVSGLVGQYAQGNEPNHHIPYLYAYAGAQWKTAERVRMLLNDFYKAEPDGLSGNEDCGQMSAWYVSSALGIFQVTPSQGIYTFGSPLFNKSVIHLPGNRDFTITARNNSKKNVYIQSVHLNGKNYTKSFISYADIMKGGTLEFTMSSTPNKSFGKSLKDRPQNQE